MTGCDSQEQQDEFVQDAGATPEGFARTDQTGLILDDDQNDWRVAPVYGGKVRFDPAYPNPVAASFVTIPVTILEFNSIQGGLTFGPVTHRAVCARWMIFWIRVIRELTSSDSVLRC